MGTIPGELCDVTSKRNGVKRNITTGLRIGTWNVRTMNIKGKLENVKKEMKRHNINILGLSEMRWKGEGEFDSDDYRVIYKGGNHKENGVGFVYEKKLDNTISKVMPISERVMAIKMLSEPVETLIIQVYMPTSEATEEEVDQIYDQIEDVYEENGKGQVRTIIIGDWNSVVGKGRQTNVVGDYGLGKRNERGDKLVNFCDRLDLCIANTWFKNHPRRLYTWKAPGDIARYQIDFILANQRFKNSIKVAKTYPGADANSDHNLLVIDVRTRLKHVKRRMLIRKWNVIKLKNGSENAYTKNVEEKLVNIQKSEGVTEEWNNLRDAMRVALEEEVGVVKNTRNRKDWVTQSMLDKMEERRRWKNISTEEGRKQYKKLNNELRRLTDQAREKWMEKQCEEVEFLEKNGRLEEMYRSVKEMTKKEPKKISKQGMLNKYGKITTSVKENKIIWKEYVEELYDSKAEHSELVLEDEGECEEMNRGPKILKEEVEKAIKDLGEKKAMGCDKIPAEALKKLGNGAILRLTNLFNKIYDTGVWPQELLKTILVPLPKKGNAKECKDFRTISFICHATKAVTRIILKRIEKKIEENMGDDQFGFRRGKGTRDAIGCLRMIGERMLDVNKDLYVCFIDWEKAFDKVNWNILLKILRDMGIDWKDRRLIKELYCRQTVVVRVGEEETEEMGIGRGVRQGCCLSPMLFNVYAERLTEKALENERGVVIGGERMKTIKYADDQAVLAETEEELQRMMENIARVGEEFGMNLNVSKTKVMRISREEGHVSISLKGKDIEEVKTFKYLGSLIKSNGSSTEEIRSRIAMGKGAYVKVKTLLTAQTIPIKLRKRFAKCFVWSVVLYGCESWTIKKKEERYLDNFEMWLWRRLMKVKWTDRVRNEEVLTRIGEEKKLLDTIRRRKRNWLGHILRRNCLQLRIIEGKIEGKRGRGRKRIGMLDDVKEGRRYQEMKEVAQDRIKWRKSS